jgi:hypothetical protein
MNVFNLILEIGMLEKENFRFWIKIRLYNRRNYKRTYAKTKITVISWKSIKFSNRLNNK